MHALLSGQTINGTRNAVRIFPGSVFLYLGPVPGLLKWACPEQLGLSLIVCGLVLGDSTRPCTNGVSLLDVNLHY